MKLISILTPTYNRENTLNRLFNSLLNQKKQNFEWIVIDDGSTDNTKKLVNVFLKQSEFKIKYIYKKNGGKHTAINLGVLNSKCELSFILDSDDYLKADATEEIEKYWLKYKNNNKICGLSFLKGDINNNIIGDKFPYEEYISNHIDYRHNRKIYGDKAEVFKTDVLKLYKFPEEFNEKLVPEDLVWTRISIKYDTVYINKIIYLCEYQSDGISSGGRKYLFKSPNSLRMLYNESVDSRFKLNLRLKHSIQYCIYSFFADKKIKNIIFESNNKKLSIFSLPVAYIIYLFWKNSKGEKAIK